MKKKRQVQSIFVDGKLNFDRAPKCFNYLTGFSEKLNSNEKRSGETMERTVRGVERLFPD